jgi:hypothetical protein
MAIITLNNNSLSSVTALPAGVGGKVLQVVYNITSTETNSTSSTWLDVLSLNITPSSASNKVLALASGGGCIKSSGDTQFEMRITRDGSQVGETKGLNTGNTSNLFITSTTINELDEPNSNSALTYKIQIRNRDSSGNCTICQNGADTSITLMEVAG